MLKPTAALLCALSSPAAIENAVVSSVPKMRRSTVNQGVSGEFAQSRIQEVGK
jgi:hypothetical protein